MDNVKRILENVLIWHAKNMREYDEELMPIEEVFPKCFWKPL